MPIYEYRCGSCGHELEALQKISDAPLTDCPECKQASLAKQVSAAGFRLKGGGWYETDFKGGKKKNLAGEAGAPAKSANATKGGSGAAGAA
ncbi:zinc ribbon domain-containing protein [Simiduia sp. 21SJ11W-1]|uniref:FmdB family zinc ribbon protein n=1 Tax=Simiduia sp. 21SJ11W-1 TaxID=2909669 RepID=UPI00209CE205|nr:zinc ribbon domain-containing protein [Simiduia sp. 21SJ11W-1]UTA49096.1 zinc ribbon domain-containing protein [Simiduia sp. 21SJ11W-1]